MSVTRRRRWCWMACVVVVCGGILAYFFIPRTSAADRTFDGPSTGLEKTVVVPTLDTPLPAGKSAIWCASFQLAWQDLTSVVGGPIQLAGADEVTQRLNGTSFSTADLAPGTHYSAAGFTKSGIGEQIRQEMSAQFPDVAVPDFGTDNVAIAFAFLEAAIPFEYPYFEDSLTFRDSEGEATNVRAFGVRKQEEYGMRELRRQVELLFAKEDWERGEPAHTEFAVDLCKTSTPHQIVLAVVPKAETLAKTLAEVQSRIQENVKSGGRFTSFEIADHLLVPTMHWRIRHRFSELEGPDKLIQNAGWTDSYVDQAFQVVQFRLDKGGAELRSQAGIVVKFGPRFFHFDRPYLIYMKKRDAKEPFFVMWVDNTELMVK
jgi:hypothetical protein